MDVLVPFLLVGMFASVYKEDCSAVKIVWNKSAKKLSGHHDASTFDGK
jgi:hypothetical protein